MTKRLHFHFLCDPVDCSLPGSSVHPDGFIDSKDGKNLTYSQKKLVTVGEQKIKISYKDFMFLEVYVEIMNTLGTVTYQ